jgi:hypothetical protein
VAFTFVGVFTNCDAEQTGRNGSRGVAPSVKGEVSRRTLQQVVDTAAAIHNPFEQAFFAMVHLPYLQPFEDVKTLPFSFVTDSSLGPPVFNPHLADSTAYLF